MTNLEINRQFADLLGMRPIISDGGLWDEGNSRTRILRDSPLYNKRVAIGIKHSDDFIFDAFTSYEDMHRVEFALGIQSHTLPERAAIAMIVLTHRK